ncbi:MurR/RpiR family transcriptional regulator [Vibrio sp. TH_r3]|uniref:MurR/RpiR family transcriptional regulator n=1 Tax=Vibrio sp. TH_r3 TaxID=3082084 RepID=UPI0029534BCF|nr:MurR/RpiR family transcriptional regulator [Vibrio sp. TH_r3]MDV7105132.1 MurR/RpiR family transcriptional regulator [Vibrio sp. TH_r3]
MNNGTTVSLPSITQQLKSARGNMTKSELKIMDQFLRDPTSVISSSAREFSKLVGVSDASIIRFSQKYGFTGYLEMKERLNQELIHSPVNKPQAISADIFIEDTLADTVDKISSIINQSIEDTKKQLCLEDLERCVSRIDNANRVFFIGMGGSGLTAQEAQYKFSRIGVDATGFYEKHAMTYKIQYTNTQDVLIAVSHTGTKSEIIDTANTAKENGAFCIAITNNRQSELSRLCDLTFDNCSQGELYQGDSIGTRVSQMFVVDIIYTELAKRRFDSIKFEKLMIKNKINP